MFVLYHGSNGSPMLWSPTKHLLVWNKRNRFVSFCNANAIHGHIHIILLTWNWNVDGILIPSSSSSSSKNRFSVTFLKMDEDSLKRYTDCVYFLASPLTCKKVPLLSILFIHSSFCNANIFFDCRKPSFCFSFQLYYVSFFFFFSAYLMCWSLIHYMTFLLAIADVLDLMLFALCFSGGWMWVSA